MICVHIQLTQYENSRSEKNQLPVCTALGKAPVLDDTLKFTKMSENISSTHQIGQKREGGRTGRGVGGENAEEIVHEAGLFIVICTYCLFCLEIRNFLNTNLCTVICVRPGHVV